MLAPYISRSLQEKNARSFAVKGVTPSPSSLASVSTPHAFSRSNQTGKPTPRAPNAAEALIAKAKSFLGVLEHGENRGKQVEKFQKGTGVGGHDGAGGQVGEAWCADFVQYCTKSVEKSTGQNSRDYNSGRVSDIWNKSSKDLRLSQPKVGSLVVWPGHIGIVAKVSAKGYSTIEGNTGGQGGEGVHSHQYKFGGDARFLKVFDSKSGGGSSPTPTPHHGGKQKYVVHSGDTLSGIAEKKMGNGNRWHEIREADGTKFTEKEAKNLQVGTSIYLPSSMPSGNSGGSSPTPTPHHGGKQKYVVHSGDTLSGIAEKKLGNGNRWHEIREADGTKFTEKEAKNLQVGTSIYLPSSKPGGNGGSSPVPKPKPNGPGKHINQEGLNLVEESEGLRLKAYKDFPGPRGTWTIGYGHTHGVHSGDSISKSKAETFLKSDIKWAEAAVQKNVKVHLTSNQFSALTSLTFNLGPNGYSGLLKDLNAGNYKAAAKDFGDYVHAGGEVLLGLVTRRDKEKKLFLKP